MKNATTALVIVLCLSVLPASAAKVKMPPAPIIELDGALPLPLVGTLDLSEEFRTKVEVVKTSPFDRLKFPIGQFMVELLEKNLPNVFQEIHSSASGTTGNNVPADVRVSAEILKFEVKIPHPAYNPYHSSVVLKISLSDPDGELLFTQTAAGSGQTSKGMMSGFKAKSIAAEVVKLAIVDAATQAFEGLLEAEDLREVEPLVPDNSP
ncbi:MAG: hypothetical protein GY906_33875 [bacterium]|nr:hypothetical protein [bacterium]